jgi:hypothetical protein
VLGTECTALYCPLLFKFLQSIGSKTKFDDFRSEKQRSKIIFSLVERPA